MSLFVCKLLSGAPGRSEGEDPSLIAITACKSVWDTDSFGKGKFAVGNYLRGQWKKLGDKMEKESEIALQVLAFPMFQCSRK